MIQAPTPLSQSNYNDFVAKESSTINRQQAISEMQKSVLEEAAKPKDILQDQAYQLTASAPDLKSAQKTANSQLKKGYLDVKV